MLVRSVSESVSLLMPMGNNCSRNCVDVFGRMGKGQVLGPDPLLVAGRGGPAPALLLAPQERRPRRDNANFHIRGSPLKGISPHPAGDQGYMPGIGMGIGAPLTLTRPCSYSAAIT